MCVKHTKTKNALTHCQYSCNHTFKVFTFVPCILILSKFFNSPTDALVSCLKNYIKIYIQIYINLLASNDDYSGRTAPLTSKCCILYIYSTNIGTEYFKHGICSPFFPLQNAVFFIILTYLVPVLFIFYIQNVLKFKKLIPAPKG